MRSNNRPAKHVASGGAPLRRIRSRPGAVPRGPGRVLGALLAPQEVFEQGAQGRQVGAHDADLHLDGGPRRGPGVGVGEVCRDRSADLDDADDAGDARARGEEYDMSVRPRGYGEDPSRSDRRETREGQL